jgi:signal transduction histidine kinase
MSVSQQKTDAAAVLTASQLARRWHDLASLASDFLRRALVALDHHRWFLLLVPIYAIADGGTAAIPLAAAATAALIPYSITIGRLKKRWPHRLERRGLLIRCVEIILICFAMSLVPGLSVDSLLFQAAIYAILVGFAAMSLGPDAIAWVTTCAVVAVAVGVASIAAEDPSVVVWLGSEYFLSAGLYTITLWLLYLAIGLLAATANSEDGTASLGLLVPERRPEEDLGAPSALSDDSRITEIAAHRERLATMGEVTAQVVHYLSSPLTGIATIVDDLLQDCGEFERGSLELVKSEAERASAIVRDLLTFTRRDDSNPVASLNEVTERALSLFALRDRSSNIKVSRDLCLEPALVRVGPSQLEQIVLNLLDNANHAIDGKEPGSITVCTRTHGDWATLQVSDNGTGIPKKLQNRIFEPFFTTKEPDQGTGLGLAIVAGVVREAGGRISLDSQVGSGSTFTISFPRAR